MRFGLVFAWVVPSEEKRLTRGKAVRFNEVLITLPADRASLRR